MQPPSWLYGLQDYFDFKDDYVAKLFVDQLISVYFSNSRANSVKNLCLSDAGDPTEKLSRFNFYFKLLENEPIDFLETASVMRKRLPERFLLDLIHKYIRHDYNITHLSDGFSRGQIQSKIWLVKELQKISPEYKDILIYAGWMGQLVLFLDNFINFEKIRIIDQDPEACEISDKIINNHLIEDWKVKSSCGKIEEIEQFMHHCIVPLTNKSGATFQTKYNPDLLINTSAEHMDETWFYNYKNKDTIIAIQSNNLFDIEEHINCVTSVDAMKKKFKMSEILYEGELELPGYKRFMLIGKK
jgi:hypothetical protein